MIDYVSWALIIGGLVVLVVSYARYFFGGRRVSKADSVTVQEDDQVDPHETLSNMGLDPELMERALHTRLPDNQRQYAERLPAELDPVFEELAAVDMSSAGQYVDDAREEMTANLDADLFDEEEAADILSPMSYANDRELTCLNVMAKPGRVLSGAALKGQFLGRGFEHGEMQIFHSRFNQQTLFSVVSMVEPGYFDPEGMDAMTTPGISFFLQLPGPLRDDVAFDMMLSEAHELAQALDAELRDEHHAPLTRNSLEDIRARLIRSANARYGSHDHV